MKPPNDESIIDFLLNDHGKRSKEAEVLCREHSFSPTRHPPHIDVQGVTSTPKRPPRLSTDDARRDGKCVALLSVLKLGKISIRCAADAADIAPSTLGDARRRLEKTSSTEPRKWRRKEGSGGLFTDESLEGLQYFIDLNSTATPREMQEFLTDSFNITPDISTISKTLTNLKITNEKVVTIPAAS